MIIIIKVVGSVTVLYINCMNASNYELKSTTMSFRVT